MQYKRDINMGKLADFKEVNKTIDNLNKHGANIFISQINNDMNIITIQDADTHEIYFEDFYSVWLFINKFLGIEWILQYIT